MIDKVHEKHRTKKLKGYKYFKNKRRHNVTVVYSDPLSKPDDNTFSDVERYELESQTSNSVCESPRKKGYNFRHFNIEKAKKCEIKDDYKMPLITRAYSKILAKKSFDNDPTLFGTF